MFISVFHCRAADNLLLVMYVALLLNLGARILAHIGLYVPGAGNGLCRQDVAKFMLQCLTTHDYDNKMVAITGSDAA